MSFFFFSSRTGSSNSILSSYSVGLSPADCNSCALVLILRGTVCPYCYRLVLHWYCEVEREDSLWKLACCGVRFFFRCRLWDVGGPGCLPASRHRVISEDFHGTPNSMAFMPLVPSGRVDSTIIATGHRRTLPLSGLMSADAQESLYSLLKAHKMSRTKTFM